MRISGKERKSVKYFTLAAVFITAGFWSSEAFSLDVMGPPAAGTENGMFEAGIEYTNSKMDLEFHNGLYSEYIDGVFDNWGEALDITLRDLKINRTYAKFGYGFYNNAEVFLRLGGFNAKFGDSIWEDSEQFDSGPELAAGGGIKLTFFRNGKMKLGGLFQLNTSHFDGRLEASHWAAADSVEINLTEAQLAAGASYACNEHLTIYGGPFLHFINGDISDEFSQVDSGTGGLLTSKYTWDIKQESALGGYIGAQMSFNENCSFNLEYQQTADASAFGIGLLLKF